MNTQAAIATAETEIRELIDRWKQVVYEKDFDKIMALYTPNVRAFDCHGGIQFRGVDDYRKHWEACLKMCPTPLTFEHREIEVDVEGDMAFCHFLVRCLEAPRENEDAGWLRGTVCFRKIDGEWKTVHEHLSAPFDPESERVVLNIPMKPE